MRSELRSERARQPDALRQESLHLLQRLTQGLVSRLALQRAQTQPGREEELLQSLDDRRPTQALCVYTLSHAQESFPIASSPASYHCAPNALPGHLARWVAGLAARPLARRGTVCYGHNDLVSV